MSARKLWLGFVVFEKKWRIEMFLFLLFGSGGAVQEALNHDGKDFSWWWLVLQLLIAAVWVWLIRSEIKKRTR